jgi:hypothetical protein
MSSSLEKLVSLMEGSNHLIWATTMELYLKAIGLWLITSSVQNQPTVPTATMTNAAEVCTAQDTRNRWDNENDQAMGAILLHIDQSLHHHHTSRQATAHVLWTYLATTSGTQGPMLIFTSVLRFSFLTL